MTVLFHGFLGMRTVVARLRPPAGPREFLAPAALHARRLLFVIGTIVVI